jgi:probable H4MPT-linked C1 transfer pathway protein
MDGTRRILVFEFISAGGLGEAALEAGNSLDAEPLLAQGARMRDALLAELLALPGLEVVVADGGLVALPPARPAQFQGSAQGSARGVAPNRLRVLPTPAAGDLVEWLRVAAAEVDLVWAIAPETDDILQRLCEAVPPARWIGCSAAAIRLASSKTRTRDHLAAQGLPVPQAWEPGQPAPGLAPHTTSGSEDTGRWVLKPDDGAGSEHTRVFAHFGPARAALEAALDAADARTGSAAAHGGGSSGSRWTLEAWVEGEALSLSLLCAAGRAEVLSVNRQRLTVATDGQLGYAGVDTGIEPPTPPLQDLADRIVAAVPGLAGFVGIDLVRQPDGGLCIIEINPRLTCAYAGLVAPPPGSADSRGPTLHGRNLAADIIAAHDATAVIGWDIGGAHVKASLLEAGTITAIGQWPTPLWKGLAHLDAAVQAARARWPQFGHAHHAVTMTAEMTDLFPDREAGVRALCERLAGLLGPAVRFYAGEAGWLAADAAVAHWPAVASANWLASASLVAQRLPDAVLIDIGSTTTDLIPIRACRPIPTGRSDATRLASGELVYLGVVRSPLCALARRIRFRGSAYNVMNEFFATTADVFRLTGELDPAHDHYPPADGGARDEAGSRLRLARMIGHDARDASATEWREFALRWRAQMLAEIRRNLVGVIRRAGLPATAQFVAAGCGAFLVRELAAQLGHPCIGFDALAAVAPDCADWARVCAPSVAVGQLAGNPASASS